jgi:hypothetical protein
MAVARTNQQRRERDAALREAFHKKPNGPCPLHLGSHAAKDCGVLSTLYYNVESTLEQAVRQHNRAKKEAQAAHLGYVGLGEEEETAGLSRSALSDLLKPIGKLVGSVEQLTAAMGSMAVGRGGAASSAAAGVQRPQALGARAAAPARAYALGGATGTHAGSGTCSSRDCSYCGSQRHAEQQCYLLHPEQAPANWPGKLVREIHQENQARRVRGQAILPAAEGRRP